MSARDLSGKRPAGVETADLLSVKKETTEEDSDYHTLTLPVQRKKMRGKKTNFNNKPVNTPIWIPRSHNCLNSPPLVIVIIMDTLLRDSISSINQPHTYTHGDTQTSHHTISICPIISLTQSKIPLLLQEGNYRGLRAVQVHVCVCA